MRKVVFGTAVLSKAHFANAGFFPSFDATLQGPCQMAAQGFVA
jgi:hypothetical protein